MTLVVGVWGRPLKTCLFFTSAASVTMKDGGMAMLTSVFLCSGGRRWHAGLVRLRRKQSEKVERDDDKLRKGECEHRRWNLPLCFIMWPSRRVFSPQSWAAGDIVSCLIDLDEGTITFCLWVPLSFPSLLSFPPFLRLVVFLHLWFKPRTSDHQHIRMAFCPSLILTSARSLSG